MPSIIAGLGYTAARAQLLSAPPFICGCISTLIIGTYSDRANIRGPIIAGSAFVSLIGYLILYTQSTPGASYAGAILVCVGVYPNVAVNLAWAGGNAGGVAKRGIILAIVIGFSNIGG